MITFLDHDFSELNTYLDESNFSKIIILADENTHEHCLPILVGNLETDIPFEIIEIEAGEDLKTIETATQLWEILTEFEVDRKALLINLGGGVITDIGGFVASTYKRGIRFINMPTTLLAMCDASIGGKTGIDHGYYKNIVGTFVEAERIFVYPQFLQTLPFIELRSGFAEMLKHGLIADATHWEELTHIEDLTPDNIIPHLQTSMKIKLNIVEKDFKEQNIRKNLNFGHTIGHAYESLFLQRGNALPHGEAIAAGMIIETHLANLENLINDKVASEIVAGIDKFFPRISIEQFALSNVITLMINDKKNNSGRISFSLLNKIGEGIFDYHLDEHHIENAIWQYIKK